MRYVAALTVAMGDILPRWQFLVRKTQAFGREVCDVLNEPRRRAGGAAGCHVRLPTFPEAGQLPNNERAFEDIVGAYHRDYPDYTNQ